MKRLPMLAITLAVALFITGCGGAPQPAITATQPPAPPTAPPPPMANKLIMYGDLALFAGRENPENCILKSRYRRGEGVGFRMTAIDPLTGKYAETAELVVHVTYSWEDESIFQCATEASARTRARAFGPPSGWCRMMRRLVS